jgi:hypothetical protein
MQCLGKTTTACAAPLRGEGACPDSAQGIFVKLNSYLVKNVSKDVLSIRPLILRVVLGCVGTTKHISELAEEV